MESEQNFKKYNDKKLEDFKQQREEHIKSLQEKNYQEALKTLQERITFAKKELLEEISNYSSKPEVMKKVFLKSALSNFTSMLNPFYHFVETSNENGEIHKKEKEDLFQWAEEQVKNA